MPCSIITCIFVRDLDSLEITHRGNSIYYINYVDRSLVSNTKSTMAVISCEYNMEEEMAFYVCTWLVQTRPSRWHWVNICDLIWRASQFKHPSPGWQWHKSLQLSWHKNEWKDVSPNRDTCILGVQRASNHLIIQVKFKHSVRYKHV